MSTSLMNEQSLKSQTQSWSFDDTSNVNEGEDSQANASTTSVRKRTRATADQLSVLEETFAVNVSPNSKLRKQLAEQLNMTERSIQIWFQNRRAKVKHIQKKAQMQIHQASIRAQLYQYQQQHQHLLQPYQQPYHYHNPNHLANLARSHSVDSLHNHHPYNDGLNPSTPLSYSNTPPPMPFTAQHPLSISPSETLRLPSKSMPPQAFPHDINSVDPFALTSFEFPDQNTRSKSTVPTLVSVPDAGPTAVLATSSVYYPTPSPNISYSQASSTDTPAVSTIDPSNLMISSADTDEKKHVVKPKTPVKEATTTAPKPDNHEKIHNVEDNEEPKDLYLSTTTLTIGSWHRLKMQETDLVCVYRPDTRIFAWHIVDGGYHFKMEVPQNAVSSIDFILEEHETLADVHFDISEPPLFFMESTTSTLANDKKNKKKSIEEKEPVESVTPIWVQCSDFTEGKQASRLFRHTLKGVSHLMKQELITLISNHEETRRLVHFIDTRMPYPSNLFPMSYQPDNFQSYHQQHPHLDSNTENHLVQPWYNEPVASELFYMN